MPSASSAPFTVTLQMVASMIMPSGTVTPARRAPPRATATSGPSARRRWNTGYMNSMADCTCSCLISAVFALFAAGSLTQGLGQMIFPAFVLWYANREDIQQHFMQGAATRR